MGGSDGDFREGYSELSLGPGASSGHCFEGAVAGRKSSPPPAPALSGAPIGRTIQEAGRQGGMLAVPAHRGAMYRRVFKDEIGAEEPALDQKRPSCRLVLGSKEGRRSSVHCKLLEGKDLATAFYLWFPGHYWHGPSSYLAPHPYEVTGMPRFGKQGTLMRSAAPGSASGRGARRRSSKRTSSLESFLHQKLFCFVELQSRWHLELMPSEALNLT